MKNPPFDPWCAFYFFAGGLVIAGLYFAASLGATLVFGLFYFILSSILIREQNRRAKL